MKTWARELAALALLAGACAWALPRAVLPRTAAPASRILPIAYAAPPPPEPARAPRAPRAPAAAPTVVTIQAAEPADPVDEPEAPPRGARERVAPSGAVPRGAITRRNGWWVVDLRALPPVRSALAGTQLQLPNEGTHGEGYRVVRTDRNGLLATAGIRPGDVLVGVDDLPLRSPDDVIDAVGRLRRASRATFVFRRGGAQYRVPVEVVGRRPGAGMME